MFNQKSVIVVIWFEHYRFRVYLLFSPNASGSHGELLLPHVLSHYPLAPTDRTILHYNASRLGATHPDARSDTYQWS